MTLFERTSGRSCSGWAAATRRRRTSSPSGAWPALGRRGPRPCCAAGTRSAGRSRCSGCGSRTRSGWPPGWTRTASRCPPGPRWGSASSRSARSPRTRSRATTSRGCSGCATARRSSTGWASTTRVPPPWPPGWRRSARSAYPLGISLGKSKVTPLDEAVDDYLTSYNAAAAVRRLHRGQRLLAEHARAAARCRTGRRWRALLGALVGQDAGAGQDRAGPDRAGHRGAARGVPGARRGRRDRHQHHPRPGRAGGGRPAAGGRGRRAVRAAADRAGPQGGAFRARGDRRRAADHRRRRDHGSRTTRRGCSTRVRRWCSSTPASSTADRRWSKPIAQAATRSRPRTGHEPPTELLVARSGARLASVRADARAQRALLVESADGRPAAAGRRAGSWSTACRPGGRRSTATGTRCWTPRCTSRPAG